MMKSNITTTQSKVRLYGFNGLCWLALQKLFNRGKAEVSPSEVGRMLAQMSKQKGNDMAQAARTSEALKQLMKYKLISLEGGKISLNKQIPFACVYQEGEKQFLKEHFKPYYRFARLM